MKAYVMVEVEAGKVKNVLEEAKGVGGVECAQAVVGPVDVIVYADVKDMKELCEVVCEKLHKIDGVKKTTTCIVVEM